jgi:hypothetical protein
MTKDTNQAGPEPSPPPQPSRPASGQPSLSDAEVAALRLARIQEYLVESLQQLDALEANLGAAAADLMSLGCQLKVAIEESLAETPHALERFQRLQPAISEYLKVARQIDRYAQLDQRLRERRTGGQAPPSR